MIARVPTWALLVAQLLLGLGMAASVVVVAGYALASLVVPLTYGMWSAVVLALVALLVAVALVVLLEREVRERERDRELLSRLTPTLASPAHVWYPEPEHTGWDRLRRDVARAEAADVWAGAR